MLKDAASYLGPGVVNRIFGRLHFSSGWACSAATSTSSKSAGAGPARRSQCRWTRSISMEAAISSAPASFQKGAQCPRGRQSRARPCDATPPLCRA